MAQRRQIRLRKEYLQSKHEELKEATISSKKQKLAHALENDAPIPTEILPTARELAHKLEMDIYAQPSVDDEYSRLGSYDPKVCVTSSRDPSSKLKQFTKEICLIIPNSTHINRGNLRVDELVAACRKGEFTDVIVVNETRGIPDGLIISHLPFGPTAYFTLTSPILRHDLPEAPHVSSAPPHLIMDGMNSRIGQRLKRILQGLFPPASPSTPRVVSFVNQGGDYLSLRHHMYRKEKGQVVLDEVGPRFEMLPYEIRLGTLDQKDAEKEWVYRPHLNTARKKHIL
eukprot:gene36012-43673_t